MADLLQLAKRHQLHPHAYADDTRIYGFCLPSEASQLQERIFACVNEVAMWMWMRTNRLQLNAAKTDVLWCTSRRWEDHILLDLFRVGSDTIAPVIVFEI